MRSRPGFTLMEMVVVVFLFSVLMVAAMNIFTIAQRTQRKSAAIQRLQDDLRYLTNRIASDVRVGTIDYEAYGGTIAPGGEEYLALRDPNGVRLVIGHSAASDLAALCGGVVPACPADSSSCLVMGRDGVCSVASSNRISFDTLRFFVSPGTEAEQVTQQSAVRVVVGARSELVAGVDPVVTQLQTTVTTRKYLR